MSAPPPDRDAAAPPNPGPYRREPARPAPEWSTLATYRAPHEAQIARGLLQANGIEARVLDEASVGMLWHLTAALGGVRLQVDAGDVARARSLLATEPPAEVDDEPADPTREADDTAARAWRQAVIGIFFCPALLHAYSLWQLAPLLRAPARLSARGRRHLASALALDLAVLALALAAWLRARG